MVIIESKISILKEINPEYSLKGLILELELQYFGHLIQRANLLEMTLMLGKMEGKRRRLRMRWLGSHQLKGHETEQTPGAYWSTWGQSWTQFSD